MAIKLSESEKQLYINYIKLIASQGERKTAKDGL